jgi:DNA-directed RNA polymerase specialized sigma24 family protein
VGLRVRSLDMKSATQSVCPQPPATAVSDVGPSSGSHGWFNTTHWSVILAAGQEDAARRMPALEKLCEAYWQPVYALIRHAGYEVHDAQDLTQTFFLQLLEREAWRNLDPRKGRFRSFLVVLLRHFLANETKRNRAAKRGGGQLPLSLEAGVGEAHFLAESGSYWPAERLFDRHWALTVMARAFAGLRAECEGAGQNARFEQLKVFLAEEGEAGAYARAAANLGLTVAAVKVAVHRLRHRYGEWLRLETARTVESPFEVEVELRYLLELLLEQGPLPAEPEAS